MLVSYKKEQYIQKGEREYSYRSDLAINHNIDSIQCGASGNEILNDFVW